MSVTQTNTQRFSVDEITARPMRSLTLPKMDRVFDGTSTNISKHERTLTPSTVASSSWSPNRLLGLLSFESDDDIETADESIHFELTPRAVSDTNLSTVHKSFDHHDIEHEKQRWCRDLMKSCDTPRAWNCSATRKSYDNFARGDNNEIDSAEIKNLSDDIEQNISDVGLCKPCTTGEEKYLSSSSSHISQPFLFWNGYALLKYDQVEDYQRRDYYIVGGYRPTMLFRDAIRTFVHIHNESGNIWSHAIATICTAIMFAFWLRDNHHTAKLDVFYFGTMCAHFVTLVCLFFSSTTYHLFTCSCRRVSRCFLEMDSIMIVMVLYSSYLSFLAGFPCSDMFRRNCIILASIFVVLMVSVRLIPDSVVSKSCVAGTVDNMAKMSIAKHALKLAVNDDDPDDMVQPAVGFTDKECDSVIIDKSELIMTPLRLLFDRGRSQLFGKVADLPVPKSLRKPLYERIFVDHYGADLNEAAKPIDEYETVNEIFSRNLKDIKKLRPIAPMELGSMCCPCDSNIANLGEITEDKVAQIKNSTYRASAFCGTSWDELSKSITPTSKLMYVVHYLSPAMYHRFHSPCKWAAETTRHFTGEVFPVFKSFVAKFNNLFPVNERIVVSGKWDGNRPIHYGAVAAYNVGGIVFPRMAPDLKTNQPEMTPSYENGIFQEKIAETPEAFDAGDQMGYFKFGSTIVIIFETPKNFVFDKKIGDNVRMGELLGHLA